METVSSLLGGQVRLWLADPINKTAEIDSRSPSGTGPPSELMRHAVTTQQAAWEQAEPDDRRIIAVPLVTDNTVLGVLQAA